MSEFLSADTARQEKEDSWRLKVEDAYQRYQAASAQYRRLLAQKPKGAVPSQDDPLIVARHAQSETLAEYMRLLKAFAELMWMPHEWSAMDVNGREK
jgi:hypothetical protein